MVTVIVGAGEVSSMNTDETAVAPAMTTSTLVVFDTRVAVLGDAVTASPDLSVRSVSPAPVSDVSDAGGYPLDVRWADHYAAKYTLGETVWVFRAPNMGGTAGTAAVSGKWCDSIV